MTVSIGQARLSVSEILELQPEAIVPLSSRIEDPVLVALHRGRTPLIHAVRLDRPALVDALLASGASYNFV